MVSIFEFDTYREYLRAHIQSLPKGGRGELSSIAKLLRVNTTWISQIMSGSQDFTVDQAHALSLYLGHRELEMDYFFLLIQMERAATSDLKTHLKKKLKNLKNESLKVANRMDHQKKLSETERAIFYSSWIYSAVHVFSSLSDSGSNNESEGGKTLEEIAARFDLSRPRAVEILHFLTSSGIVTEQSGRYSPGVQSTFLEQGSPHLLKHHSSWRVKAIQKSETLSEKEMMVTGQYSLSREDFMKLREKLAGFLKELSESLKDTNPEEIVCLNLDWFYLQK